MIDNEASALIEATQQEKQPDMIRFATVVGTFEDTGAPIIQFAGDTEPSQKSFAYMAWYSPTVGDTVACMRTGNSYFILGNVNYKVAPSGDVGKKVDEILAKKKYVEMNDYGAITIPSEAQSDIHNLYCRTRLVADGKFYHGGTRLAFFGHSYASQQSVSNASTSSTVTAKEVASTVNSLLTALRNYGLLTS